MSGDHRAAPHERQNDRWNLAPTQRHFAFLTQLWPRDRHHLP
jgi:hypothetical protein